MVLVFLYFFENFTNFCGQMCGLGSISVSFRFTKFLPSVVQPTAHQCCHSVVKKNTRIHLEKNPENNFKKTDIQNV